MYRLSSTNFVLICYLHIYYELHSYFDNHDRIEYTFLLMPDKNTPCIGQRTYIAQKATTGLYGRRQRRLGRAAERARRWPRTASGATLARRPLTLTHRYTFIT